MLQASLKKTTNSRHCSCLQARPVSVSNFYLFVRARVCCVEQFVKSFSLAHISFDVYI